MIIKKQKKYIINFFLIVILFFMYIRKDKLMTFIFFFAQKKCWDVVISDISKTIERDVLPINTYFKLSERTNVK